MQGLHHHPLRVLTRLVLLAISISIGLVDYLFRCVFCRSDGRRAARAAWLHRTTRRTLRYFQIKTQATGPVPTSGLLISNHLSYLDILVISSLTPTVFVSKHD